jgi:hypothetical protein
MQSVSAYLRVPALVVNSSQPVRISRPAQSQVQAINDVQANHLLWLAVFINILSGSAFTVAAALTSEFALMTRFWVGACLGAIVYGLISIAAWQGEGV